MFMHGPTAGPNGGRQSACGNGGTATGSGGVTADADPAVPAMSADETSRTAARTADHVRQVVPNRFIWDLELVSVHSPSEAHRGLLQPRITSCRFRFGGPETR